MTQLTSLEGCDGLIHIVPYWETNTGYIVADRLTKEAIAVDAVEISEFKDILVSQGYQLQYVLTTHKHQDHSAGNAAWAKAGVPVLGSGYEETPGITKKVKNGDKFTFGSWTIECLHTPGHTMGHICYYLSKPESIGVVFTGDFIFLAGCGYFFEGDPRTVHDSMVALLKLCPDDTWMLSGHDYARNNLRFAITVEPENDAMRKKLTDIESSTSIPVSRLRDELKFNPFLRAVHCADELPKKWKDAYRDPTALLGAIRLAKNAFK